MDAGHLVLNAGWWPLYYVTGGPLMGLRATEEEMYEDWDPWQSSRARGRRRWASGDPGGARFEVPQDATRQLGAPAATSGTTTRATCRRRRSREGIAPRLRMLAQKTWGSPQLTDDYQRVQATRWIGACMGEDENIAIVRKMFEDWNARRPAGPEILDPDVQWDARNHPVPEIRGVYRGREEVRQLWLEWLPAWEQISAEVHWIGAAGDRVVAWTTQHMVGHESGVEFDLALGWDFILRDGQYTRVAFIVDEADARAAVGGVTPPGLRRSIASSSSMSRKS